MKRNTPKLGTHVKVDSTRDGDNAEIRSTPSRIRTTPIFMSSNAFSDCKNGTGLPLTPRISKKLVTPSPRLDDKTPSRSALRRSAQNPITPYQGRNRKSESQGSVEGNNDTPQLSPSKRRKNSEKGHSGVGSLRRSGAINKHLGAVMSPDLSVTPSSSNLKRRSYQISMTPSSEHKSRRSDPSFLDSPSLDKHFGPMTVEEEMSSISVGVRVRPLNVREITDGTTTSVINMDNNSVIIQNESDSDSSYSFNYDHCFFSADDADETYASQEHVYTTMAAPLLDQAFQGYNVCLLAYGQTGSGKTYCIMGDLTGDHLSNDAGVIPRFCTELFKRVESVHSNNPPNEELPLCRVTVEMSYVEIYNEKLYDLLGRSSGEQREALKVREHPQHGPYVVGAESHCVDSFQDLKKWLLFGNQERSIAATGMNNKSSRSHTVFSLKLTQSHLENYEGEVMEHTRVSIINLVDLAGSERVAATQSQGERLKEGVYINKSLLTLGKVVTALAERNENKRPFVPYRESLLTWLLKESLGGNSRTCMIATISPSKSHIEETLSTLRYACQARKILNRRHVNEDKAAKIVRLIREREDRVKEAERNMLHNLERSRLDGIVMKVEKNEPILINLCEDPQLSQTLLYKIKNGITTVGQKETDVILRNLPHSSVHCVIEKLEDCKLQLIPKDNHDTYVNGLLIKEPKILQHNDRIVLGGIYHFRLSYPSNDMSEQELNDDKKFDYYFARDELLKAQEERLKREHAIAEKKLLCELEGARSKFNEESRVLRENNSALESDKLLLQEENLFLAEIVKRNQTRFSDDLNTSSDMSINSPKDFGDMENVFNESMRLVSERDKRMSLEVDLKFMFMIDEAASLCKSLNLPYEIDKDDIIENGKLETMFFIKNISKNVTASLNLASFSNFVTSIRQIVHGNEREKNKRKINDLLKWQDNKAVTKIPYIVKKVKEESRRLSLNTTLKAQLINRSKRKNSITSLKTSNQPPDNTQKVNSLSILANAFHTMVSEHSIKRSKRWDKRCTYTYLVELFTELCCMKDLVLNKSNSDILSNSLIKLMSIEKSTEVCILLISQDKYCDLVMKSLVEEINVTYSSFQNSLQSFLGSIEEDHNEEVLSHIENMAENLILVVKCVVTFSLNELETVPDLSLVSHQQILKEAYFSGVSKGFINEAVNKHYAFSKLYEVTNDYHKQSNNPFYRSIIQKICQSYTDLQDFFEILAKRTIILPSTDNSINSFDWTKLMKLAIEEMKNLNECLSDLKELISMNDLAQVEAFKDVFNYLQIILEKIFNICGLSQMDNSYSYVNTTSNSNSSLNQSISMMDELSKHILQNIKDVKEKLVDYSSQIDSTLNKENIELKCAKSIFNIKSSQGSTSSQKKVRFNINFTSDPDTSDFEEYNFLVDQDPRSESTDSIEC